MGRHSCNSCLNPCLAIVVGLTSLFCNVQYLWKGRFLQYFFCNLVVVEVHRHLEPDFDVCFSFLFERWYWQPHTHTHKFLDFVKQLHWIRNMVLSLRPILINTFQKNVETFVMRIVYIQMGKTVSDIVTIYIFSICRKCYLKICSPSFCVSTPIHNFDWMPFCWKCCDFHTEFHWSNS
jgi:hypothetical protein